MARFSRKFLLVLLIMAILLPSIPSALAMSIKVKTNAPAKVYKSPSTSSVSLTMKKGLSLTLTGMSGDWARVENSNGVVGYCALKYLNTVSRYTGYISQKTYIYKSASTSSTKVSLPVNTKVYVIGKSGSFYRVQNASGSVTGYIKTSYVSKTPNYKAMVVKMDWFDGGSSVLKKGEYGYIYDIESGLTIRVKRMGGTNHADLEPATKTDAAKMLAMTGGYSWDSRSVILIADGKFVACAINTMPHGDQTIDDNGYDGQFCLHMVGSRTHGSDTENSSHQAAINAAYNWAH